MKETHRDQLFSNKLSTLNYVSTMVVLAYHTVLRYSITGIETYGYIIMHFFFMVSGYFLLRKSGEMSLQITRLKKRVFSLLVPFFAWNLIYYLAGIIPVVIKNASPLLYTDSFWKEIGAVLIKIIRGDYCTPSWYLATLFIYAVLSLVLIYAYKSKFLSVLIIVAGLFISYVTNFWGQAFFVQCGFWGMSFIRSGRYMTSFLIGGLLGYRFHDKISMPRWSFILGIPVSAFTLYYMMNVNPYNPVLIILEELIVLFIWMALPDGLFRTTKIIKFVTTPSFFMIMSHGLCYRYLGAGMQKISVFQSLSGTKYGYVLVLFAVIILTTIYYLLNKFAKPILSILIGGRTK